ncbi:hypothetical protein PG984_015389 [Apiospora sp. TS-2023a]
MSETRFPTLFAVAELSYAILPVTFVWKLKMPWHNKLPLMALLCMPVSTPVASIMGTIWVRGAVGQAGVLVTQAVRQAGAMPGVARMLVWAHLDMALTIIMGCLPVPVKLFQQKGPDWVGIKSSVHLFCTNPINCFQGSIMSSQQPENANFLLLSGSRSGQPCYARPAGTCFT